MNHTDRIAWTRVFAAHLCWIALVMGGLMVGCDRQGPDPAGPPERYTNVEMTFSRQVGSGGPGNPSKLTVRFWDLNGENAAVQTVSLPDPGQTRRVQVATPPGSLYVGIMAHGDRGIVSFTAMSDRPYRFAPEGSRTINLEDDLTTWKLEYKITGGELAVGENIVLQTEEPTTEQSANQMVQGRVGDETRLQEAYVYYDSRSFRRSGDAEFRATLPWQATTDTSLIRKTATERRYAVSPLRIENEALLESMYLRVRYKIDSRWGEEPTAIVRPHPDSSALRLEDITSEVGIKF